MTISILHDHPDLFEVHGYLVQYSILDYDEGQVEKVANQLTSIKQEAVAAGNQSLAKQVWCLERVLRAQGLFAEVYRHMRKQHFYAAWVDLEGVEGNIRMLDRHFKGSTEQYGIEFLREYVPKFQSLYPYAMFVSPEIWKREVLCSICKAPVTLRNSCKHHKYEIYDGEMCRHIVTKADVLALSFTKNPVQKYSVAWTGDPATSGGEPNQDAYPLAEYVSKGLASPWDKWEITHTTIFHPHERYADVNSADECPCVDPQGTYAECCLSKEGVLRPHKLITFYKPPASELLSRIYL